MDILQKMSLDLRVSEDYLKLKIGRANYLYSKHLTYNKHGKKRLVYEPSAELKMIQKWVDINILGEFPVDEGCMAYEKNTSIRKNAYLHSKSKFILHTDIKKFFDSITYKQIMELLLQKYEMQDAVLLAKIVTRQGKLPTGSITAPKIANRILYNFDKKIREELNELQPVIYTRYADDIVVSSENYLDDRVLETIIEILKKYGFTYNKEKTYYSNKRSKRMVTGVVISNIDNAPTIGWKKYREIKLSVYKYLVHGTGNIDSLKGQLAFLKSVNANQYLAIKNYYKQFEKYEQLFGSIERV